MHLAPKHLCICFNSSTFRLSAWIFSSASALDGIVPTSTDWSIVQWLDVLVNIYIPVTFTRSDFSSSQGWWLIFRDYHVMIDNAPISDDLTEKWHTLAYFHYFEVLMDEMMNEGFSSDPFRTLSRLKQLGHTCEWSCLSLKPAWLTKIPSFIDQSCKYQLLCATMIKLCDHPLDGCLRFYLWMMQFSSVCK